MERTADDPARGRRVKAEIIGPDSEAQPEILEGGQPPLPRPVVAGNRDAVPGIPEAIHEPQEGRSERTIGRVILDEDGLTGHAPGFSEKHHRIVRVVKDVHEKHNIEARIGKWESPAVERNDRDASILADEDVDSDDGEVGATRRELPGHRSAAASNVEQPRTRGDLLGQALAEHSHSPGRHEPAVQPLEQRHRRFIPSTLMKKLDSTV